MEWLLTNTQIHSTFASLGSVQGDNYVVSSDCLEILEEINCKLEIEDKTLRSFRRAIGFGQNVRNDIIPLLVNVKDKRILEGTIRLLVNLTIPVECLMPVDTIASRHMVFELNKLLITIKESFTDGLTTKSILDYMKLLLGSKAAALENCNEINNCLLLLRNILNIPEHLHNNYFNLPRTSMQNQILWNLFTQSLDRILLQVMTSPESANWCVSLVQLIALMYKDQHVKTLQKLLNICFDASISDSSEDNESNTSPVKEENSDSSPMLTSDPTSDSSDNGGTGTKTAPDERRVSEGGSISSTEGAGCSTDFQKTTTDDQPSAAAPETTKNRKILSSTSELSDCGYATQVENNPESNSMSTSSSAEDYSKPPVHQKPPATNQKQRMNLVNKPRKVLTSSEKTEWRRKKLVKRSLSTMINMKGMVNHTPIDDDITNILKEFSVDFLLKGYGALIADLHAQLISDVKLVIDTSHFFWLVTYFLKFAGQLELDLGHVHSIFTFDIIGYSMYEAVSICEQLDTAGFEIVPSSLRRLHLSVTAIREFLTAIETYKKIGHLIRAEDVRYLSYLEFQIVSSADLRNLFVLLLRRFNPSIQSKQYLEDVIVTNHLLIMLFDRVSGRPEWTEPINVEAHIQQFASVDIMHWFGYLLEDFNENGAFVNDCIFTMMHHISGSCGNVSALFQPNILKAFSKIWDTEYEMCDDWSDLVEYVINKFISNPQSPQRAFPMESVDHLTVESVEGKKERGSLPNLPSTSRMDQDWSQEMLDSLNWYFVQAKDTNNLVETIGRHLEENGHGRRSSKNIVDQLLCQGLITAEDATKFCPQMDGGDGEEKQDSHTNDEVDLLCQQLHREKPEAIAWLQQVLLECCLIKLHIAEGVRSNRELLNEHSDVSPNILEPIILINILKKQSVPLIPWTKGQVLASVHQPFLSMLHKLGLHLAADARKHFARIPEFWTTEHLYMVATRLGPVPPTIQQRILRLQGGRKESSSDGQLLSVDNPSGYSGNDTTTRRTSAYSGVSTNQSVSLINWMDSPKLGTVMPKMSTDASNLSGPATDSFQSTFSSRKESIDDDASSAAAVMDEEELNRDVFGELEEIGQSDISDGREILAAMEKSGGAVGETVDSISVWETASQVCSSGMLCVSDEEF